MPLRPFLDGEAAVAASRDYLDLAVGGAAALSTFLDEVMAACQMREALDTSHIFTK